MRPARSQQRIVDHTIKDKPTNDPDGQHLFRNEFGGIKHVELELVGELLIEQLKAKFPFGERSGLDGVP